MAQFKSEPNASPATSAAPEVGLERRNAGALFGLISAVFAASALLPLPAANGQVAHIPAFCPFYRMTGLPCPGCGLTRAFICISHGDLAQSIHWHPIGWLVYAVFVWIWLNSGLILAFGRPIFPLTQRQKNALGTACLAVFLIAGFTRIGWLLVHHIHYV